MEQRWKIAIITMTAVMTLPLLATESTSQPDPQSATAPKVVMIGGGRSYLGVDIKDVSSDRVSALKLKEERGVEITMVDADAPAGKAGLKEHDVILDFNGSAVESEEQLRRLIREVPPGRTVTLGISRDGAPMKINVQLADRTKIAMDSMPKVVFPNFPRTPDMPFDFQVQTYSRSLGIQTEGLTRQLGEYFGVKDAEGVLVRSVEKGSAGEKAGLKAGDVIVKADNEKLNDRTDLAHILRKHHEGGKVALGVIRDKREQTISVDIPRPGSRDSSRLDFNTEDLDSLIGNIEDMMDRVKPEIWGAQEEIAMKLRPQLELLDRRFEQAKPEIDRSMQKVRREMERLQKDMQHRFQRMKDDPNCWI